MEATILVLCIALALVSVTALVSSGLRLRRGIGALREDEEKAKLPPARVAIIRQKSGDVRFAYLIEEKEQAEKTEEAEVALAAEQAPAEEQEPEGVLIPKAEKLTFKERYDRLPEADRARFDEFVAFISAKEDCESVEQTSAMSFRYFKGQIAKAVIRRETVVLSFPIANPDLGRKVREEKLKGVKMQPAELKLTDKDALELAKQTAELGISYLKQEEEYKLEKRKEARREAARKKREEEQGGDEA